MKFPLPSGHRFNINPDDLQNHDGSEFIDSHNLKVWQKRYMLQVDPESPVTGKFDGPCQRACIQVQRAYGLPITAYLDEATWCALWGSESPQEPVEVAEPALEPLEPVRRPEPAIKTARERRAERDAKTSGSNANKIIWRNRHKGTQPDWYGTPEQTQRVRSLLGFSGGSRMTEDVRVRVKGVQRAGGLLPTGEVDIATAWLLAELVPTAVE